MSQLPRSAGSIPPFAIFGRQVDGTLPEQPEQPVRMFLPWRLSARADAPIVVNAHRINRGLMPEVECDPESDFHFVECQDAEDGLEKVLWLITEHIPARFGLDPVREVQVLCPMHRGGLGACALNLELQQALNPPGEGRVERFGWTYAVGDKVMQPRTTMTRTSTTATSVSSCGSIRSRRRW